MSHESVGSLLAIIANSINDGLRLMMFADKRAWGPDEFEQLRLLEETLDEAKKDFQSLPTLVHGRGYYEHDRKTESLEDLRILCSRFELHVQNFRDWVRAGGPINPVWARETIELRGELHRAQCRAARRLFNSEQEAATRCLGAFQVFRAQRSPPPPPTSAHENRPENENETESENASRRQHQERQLEELAACNRAGKFERLGERDIAFVCDFCDGYIVWEDLREMPSSRRAAHDGAVTAAEPTSATGMAPTQQQQQQQALDRNWQAIGFRMSDGAEDTVVFAPVAVANHLPPEPGEWQARILCPLCEDYITEEQGEDDMEQVRWSPDEGGFADMREFREHLEWSHAPSILPKASDCSVM